jgi:RpiR family transcriptional regulator, carbohydrate utilization regulator
MSITITDKSAELIPHSCLVKLQAVYDSLKSAERKAADLILEKPEFVSKATIVEAAEEGGCSEATFVRLARKLGYRGYPELKVHLRKGRMSRSENLYAGITEEDTCENVVKKVFQSSIQALTDTLNILDMVEYNKAVETISKANKLVFCGVGDAANVAQSGYQKFIRIGANVQVSADLDLQLITVSHLAPGDVLIVISHSGRTKSIIDLVKYTKETGATIICITNYPVSPLAKNSDITLLTAAFAEHIKGEVMSKRVAELCILESLFVNVLLKQRERFIEDLNRSNMALEVNKL